MPHAEVVCAGLLVADAICRGVRELPGPGKLALVDGIVLKTGGCALNAAITLARAGARSALVGRVGDDPFADFLLGAARAEGIDLRVRRDPGAATSASVVLVSPDGERSFLHHAGANARFALEDIPFEDLAGARFFHLAGAFVMDALDGRPGAEALRRARIEGLATSLDTVWDARGRWLGLLEPMLAHVDVFMPSAAEAEMISGRKRPEDVARFFLDRGVGAVALKRGPLGAYVTDGRETIDLKAFPVGVVDATGAGDAFAGGFLAARARGLGLKASAVLGNAAGAACVTALGAVPPFRTFEELESFVPEEHRCLFTR